MVRVALGIRMHSGWGVLVGVTESAEIIDRRRMIVIRDNVQGGKQPYHHAERIGLPAAEKYLADYILQCDRLAREELERTMLEMHGRGYRIAAAALLLASGRALPPLPQILAAHPLIHSAEGELFRYAARRGCEALSIPVMGYHERDLDAQAKKALGNPASSIVRGLASAGKSIGPPWTAEHKSAALAGYLALTSRVTGSLLAKGRTVFV
jgi:hypothetical protein